MYWVVVDSRGYLMLPDCQNMKMRLTPMERSLYILLLRYPEGIPVDDLYLYYDELGQKAAAPLRITRTDGVYRIPVKRELVSYR